MIVEPCCAKRQLPVVLHSDERFFQTSGDVLMTKFIEAISPMFHSKDTKVLITCPNINDSVLKFISGYIDDGCFGEATLLIGKYIDAMRDYHGRLILPREEITIIESPMIVDGQMMFTSGDYACIVQGAMLTEVDMSVSLYSCYYGNNKPIINIATAPLISRVHLAQKKNNI